MDVKLDKETIIKHRFWFSLPCIALCILIGWGCEVRLRGQADQRFKQAQTIKDNLAKLATDQERRSPNWINAADIREKESDRERGRLWVIGFDAQNDVLPVNRVPENPFGSPTTAVTGVPETTPTFIPLKAIRQPLITWPRSSEPNRDPVRRWENSNEGRLAQEGMQGYSLYQDPDPDKNPNAAKVLDFGEDLGIIPNEYAAEFPRQFEQIANLLPWYNHRSGEGAILTPGQDHRAYVLDTLLKRRTLEANRVTKDEAWTLQQDLAIRREIFKSMGAVMSAHSQCESEWTEVVPPKSVLAAMSKDVARPQTFYNNTWDMLVSRAGGGQADRTTDLTPSQGLELQLLVTGADGGRKCNLTAKVLNYGGKEVPDMPLEVYFVHKDRTVGEAMTPAPLRLGKVPAANANKPGEANVKAVVDLPDGAILKVSRVRRAKLDKAADHIVCGNSEWNLHLILQPSAGGQTEVEGHIVNRSARRLLVPHFRLDVTEVDLEGRIKGTYEADMPITIRLDQGKDVVAINAGESFTFKHTIPRKVVKFEKVRQTLDWRNGPIKRFDLLEIGSKAHKHSDRTRVQSLVAYDFKKKEGKYQPPGAGAPTAPAYGGGDGAPVGMGGPGGGMFNPGSGGGSAEDKKSDAHGIPLSIYLEVTTELRRLPVALVLVVREDSVTEVINALANSPLRFHVTQVAMNRLPGLPRPGAGADAGPSRPAAGGDDMGGGVGVLGGPGGGAPGRPAGGGSAPRTNRQAWAEEAGNVVELQIYGLITLYECPDAVKRLTEKRSRPPVTAGQ